MKRIDHLFVASRLLIIKRAIMEAAKTKTLNKSGKQYAVLGKLNKDILEAKSVFDELFFKDIPEAEAKESPYYGREFGW